MDYESAMSKAEILAALPTLTREERRELVMRVHEIDGDDCLDEGEPSVNEKAMLEARLREHESNPGAAIPSSQLDAQINERLSA
jgi:hypothetical protein